MYNVVMLELRAVKKVSDDSCIFGDLDTYCIFDCPHRGQIMSVGSDPAGSLGKKRSISGITSLQDKLDTSKHLA